MSGLRPPKAVLFDLDGTFVDTAPDMAHALNVLRRRHALSPLDVPTVRPHVSRGVRGMLLVGFGMTPEHGDFATLKEEFLSQYATRLCVDSALFPGIDSLVQFLESSGIAWGIVTSKASTYALPIADALGFAQRAKCVVCGDTTAHTKPHPAPLLHAARLVGVQPTDCWYIGDDERDMQAARAAGMGAIVAAYGYLGGTPHHTWPQDAAIANAMELVRLIDAAR